VGVVLQSDPEDAEALVILGHCKIDTRQFEEATTILKQCLQYESNKDYVFYLLSFTAYQQGNNRVALNYLNEALSIFPYNAGYFALAAHVHLDDKNYEKALVAADRGLLIDAENVSCLNARSTALFRLNKKDAAKETIQEALSIDPENYITHTNYGWHYLEKGRHKEAANHFREALRINPNYAYARQGYKSSLKSKLIFYRWLLQGNLWLGRQNKNFRWGMIIGVWLLVVVMDTAGENTALQQVCELVMILYFVVVVFSWLGSSLANLYILATKHGHYVLSHQEKWGARMVGLSLLASLCLLLSVYNLGRNYLFLPAVVASLSIVFNEMDYPIRPFKGKGRVLISNIILATGLVCCLAAFFNLTLATGIAAVYTLFLVGFIWSGTVRNSI
jgi:tetratricopeptide (TPR) repeat protein